MKIKTVLLTLAFAVAPSMMYAEARLKIHHLANEQNIVSVEEAMRYLLLPVQDDAPEAKLCVVENNRQATVIINVRLARERVDYYVPLDLEAFVGRNVKIDVQGMPQGSLCWEKMSLSDTFDTANTEKFRPVYHHTPAYGWMNDPNGMFYKDGVYHLYFQHNPYGSTWGNMNWGHSYSTDLVHWTYAGDAITPDAWGTVFSGSAVVDKDNTAGFGRDAVVAFYTSAKPTQWGDAQMQSLAYSTDGGKTFEKYAGNPVITSTERDFRDPKVFWYAPGKHWVMVLAVGQEMQLWSSADLKSWKYESNFGLKQGSHAGVWECPDLFELPVEGTNEKKWVLVCNINPGGPFGGSATQYFTGTFDGHKFTCDTKPEVTKWMDYGKDHYAAVSFDIAPDGRRVMIAWMSNWQYANQVPTVQFRSANAIARDVYLFRDKGVDYVGSRPVAEMTAMRGDAVVSKKATLGRLSVKNMFKAPSGAYEIDLAMAPQDGATVKMMLSNQKGEYVTIVYDGNMGTLSFDRRQGGDKSFSELFPAVTTAPVHGKLTSLRIFVDKSSVEVFGNDGRAVMTNLVFPAEPYNTLTINSDKKTTVSSLKVYPLIKK